MTYNNQENTHQKNTKNCHNINHDNKVIGVSQLSTAIRLNLEKQFHELEVRGEVSGFMVAASGHAYFTLKEGRDILACICWNGVRKNFMEQPKEGAEVICKGSITAYSGQSKYQMIVNNVQYHGEGSLMALLNKRKQMLLKEGVFDNIHKKQLPKFPKIIGVVTSESGAVIRDIIHRIRDRFPTNIVLYPTPVQGNKAAESITQGIEYFNLCKKHQPDVIIVARGGGSIEDLWPFNELNVVYATYNSKIPVISAIGHETDFTLIDFAADVRAPTPTAAAELSVPDRRNLQTTLSATEERIHNITNAKILHIQEKLNYSYKAISNPQFYILNLLDYISGKFNTLREMSKKVVIQKQYLLSNILLPKHEHFLAIQANKLINTKQMFYGYSSSCLENIQYRFARINDLFESYDCRNVLNRGYVMMYDGD